MTEKAFGFMRPATKLPTGVLLPAVVAPGGVTAIGINDPVPVVEFEPGGTAPSANNPLLEAMNP